MNQTSPKIIFLIVIAVASMAFVCIASLCTALFRHVYADPVIITAIITIAGALTGSLVTMLTSTKVPPPGSTTSTSTTTVPTPSPLSGSSSSPISVTVENSTSDPVPVESQPPTP